MANIDPSASWPALPLDAWRDTRDTLHRWTQVVGKLQLAMTPTVNHWWNVPLQITPRGLATSTMTCGDRWLDMELDLYDDVLRIRVSDGGLYTVKLAARPVTEFYADTMETLQRAGIRCQIWPVPVEIDDRLPFDRDERHHAYDKTYVMAFWRIVSRVAHILEKFRAGYLGKCSPVQFYWGHFDLALSRFSGRPAPVAIADPIEREAYTHELFSVGWWPGDDRFPKPAFYAYAAPEPPGFPEAQIATPHAYYYPPLRGFYLDYDDVREADNPEALILAFCRGTYAAAADLARWDRLALERPAARFT